MCDPLKGECAVPQVSHCQACLGFFIIYFFLQYSLYVKQHKCQCWLLRGKRRMESPQTAEVRLLGLDLIILPIIQPHASKMTS